MSNLEKVDLVMLGTYAVLLVAVFFMFASTRHAHGQYYPFYPSYTQPRPAPAPHAHHRVHVRAHFRTVPSSKHQRSAAEWKASIQAQGKAYCAKYPRDKICQH